MKKILIVAIAIFMYACGEKKETTLAETKTQGSDDPPATVQSQSALDSIPLQTFEVNIAGDFEMITAENGSCYVLPQNCFLDESGNPVNSGITVEIKEINNMNDFYRSGVSTLSNDKLLITGGSYYFGAKANGKELSINPNNKPVALLPNIKKDKEMRFFSGEPTKDGGINWIEEKEKKEVKFLEPTNLNENLVSEYDAAKCFADDLKRYYTKSGKQWKYTHKSGELLYGCVGFNEVENWYVQQILAKEKYLRALIKVKAKLVNVYNNFVRKYNERIMKNMNEQQQAEMLNKGNYDPYQFELEKPGWFNCDKFWGMDISVLTIKVTDGKKLRSAIAHFTSHEQKVHVKQVLEKGEGKIGWPKNVPLEIIYYTATGKPRIIELTELPENNIVELRVE